jgi:hypothetical protein
MKFTIWRTSRKRLNTDQLSPATQYDAERPDWPREWEAEITTLEELLAFVDRLKEPVIISPRQTGRTDYELEIYDNYRE